MGTESLSTAVQKLGKGHPFHLNAVQLRDYGCTCEFGCRSCGMDKYQMGSCPAWDPCPIGRAENPECPLVPR